MSFKSSRSGNPCFSPAIFQGSKKKGPSSFGTTTTSHGKKHGLAKYKNIAPIVEPMMVEGVEASEEWVESIGLVRYFNCVLLRRTLNEKTKGREPECPPQLSLGPKILLCSLGHTTHLVRWADLLLTGLEFPELGLVKMEPDMDGPTVWLEQCRSSG